MLILVQLNNALVNLALPALRFALGGGDLEQQWVVTAYNLVFASLLLLGGLLGDRLGHRRVLLSGLVVSLAAATSAAFAPNLAVLLAARAAQGAGSGLVLPAAVAVLSDTFSEPEARAFGRWGAVAGLGIALAPLAGGALIDAFGWRGVFVTLIAVGVLALVTTGIGVHETRPQADRRLGLAGVTLVAVSLTGLSLGLSEGQRVGWAGSAPLGLLGRAAFAFGASLVVETRSRAPLVELAAFRQPTFAAANLGGLLMFFGTFPLLTFIGIAVQQDGGLSATSTGLLILAFPLGFSSASLLGARLLARFGPRLPVLTGALTALAGALALGWIDAGAAVWVLWWRIGLLGAGVGMSMGGHTTAAVSSSAPERTGSGERSGGPAAARHHPGGRCPGAGGGRWQRWRAAFAWGSTGGVRRVRRAGSGSAQRGLAPGLPPAIKAPRPKGAEAR